jgi:hypothetical protein
MQKFLAAALITSAIVPVVYANTNAGSKIYICVTPQANDLVQADYEALSWIEIKQISNRGESGVNTNILNFPTWDTTVIQKAKGLTDAGSPTLEVARVPTDAGQVALRNAANTNVNYAFKELRNDAVTVGGVGTVLYNRGLVAGPLRPGGGNEDFDIERFTLALQQKEIVVNPGAGGIAPKVTVLPAISGTPTVGQTLTCTTGTFTGDATITYTFQWFAGGVAILGATANTYILTSAELTKIMQCRVQATNLSGTAQAYSNATTAVA